MIVNHLEDGWQIYDHYAHALLAGKIFAQLTHQLDPDTWTALCTAVVDHDDHIPDLDEKSYLTPAGAPLDYRLDTRGARDALKHARRLCDNAGQKSRYIRLMVGLHIEYLYGQGQQPGRDFAKFLKEEAAIRTSIIAELHLSESTSIAHYGMLLFADRCSLILCQSELPEAGRELEVNDRLGHPIYISRRDDGSVSLRPWPFSRDQFSFTAEYKLLTQLHFSSDKAFSEALAAAPTKVTHWEFREK